MSFPAYPAYRDSGMDWLGQIPSHWTVKRLRFVTDINPSKSEVSHLAADTEVSFLPMEAIGEDGSLELDRVRPLADVQTGYTFFRDGDVTIAKITPCFENGKGAAMRGLCNGIGFGTTELIVTRPKATQTTSTYLHWLFTSRPFRKAGEAFMYGAGGQKRVPDDFVRDFAIGFPPLPEQRHIVTFLDRETAKIDALVEEQRRLIELLKEKRQAVISQAVTKGLNPIVPTKDSGVEWLGEVPAHWDVKRVKAASTFLTSGPRGWSDHVSDDGALFVQSGDLTEALGIDFENAKRVVVADDAEAKRTQLKAGDVLVCITGAKTGKVAVCDQMHEPAFINQHICLIRPAAGLRPTYLGAFLHSAAGQRYFELAQYGLKQGLSLENVKQAAVPVPPRTEQDRIVDHVNRLATELGNLTAAADMSIALLHERRSALISAAVTGKIDVRGLVPQPEAAAA